MASEAKGLTATQLRVLKSIVRPHPDDEPFPRISTVKALVRMGLVRTIAAREVSKDAAPMEIVMTALGSERIVATPAGLLALREADDHDT